MPQRSPFGLHPQNYLLSSVAPSQTAVPGYSGVTHFVSTVPHVFAQTEAPQRSLVGMEDLGNYLVGDVAEENVGFPSAENRSGSPGSAKSVSGTIQGLEVPVLHGDTEWVPCLHSCKVLGSYLWVPGLARLCPVLHFEEGQQVLGDSFSLSRSIPAGLS